MKKLVSVVLAILMLSTLISCNLGDAIEDKLEEKEFTADSMTITLHEGFVDSGLEGFTASWIYNKTSVFAIKEDFSKLDGYADINLEEYADLVLKSNAGKNPGKIKTEDGLTYFEYDFVNEDVNIEYSYLTVLYSEGNGVYWMVQFSTVKKDYDARRDTFIKWAKSVEFAD